MLDNLKLGLGFRSAVGLDFKGDVDFQLPEGVPKTVAANFPDGKINAELTLPHSFALGVGWDAEDFTVEVSANLTLWQSYDELRINFDSGLPSPSSAAPRDWNMAPTFRLGGEYRITEMISARLGGGYDMTPMPDETIDVSLPDSDRILASGGVGGKFGPVLVDVSYMLVYKLARESKDSVNFPVGQYPGNAIHLAALTLGAEF